MDDELLAAIVGSRLAAPTVARLAELLASDESAVEARIVAAFDAGEVEPWEGDAPRVSLTAWSAERLGLELDDSGGAWVRPDRLRRPNRIKAVDTVASTGTDAWMNLGATADPAPGPLELAIRREGGSPARREGGSHVGADHVPLPTVLLGQRLQWPAAPWQTIADGPTRRDDCPGCGGKLRPHEYCLVCDRYGREWMLPKVKRERRRSVEARAAKKTRRERRASASIPSV